MELRAWSARRLSMAWVIGLAAELVLFGGASLYSRLTEPPANRAARLRADGARLRLDSAEREWRAQDDSIARGLRPPLLQATPEQIASLRTLLRDSLGISWDTRGRVTTVQMPPALAAGVGRATTRLTIALWEAFLLAALIALPIPLALLGLTLAWLFARRRSPPGAAAA